MPTAMNEPQTMTASEDASHGTISFREMQAGDDPTAFRTLNEEWITNLFTLEPRDREVLGDPSGTILAKGGRIFFCG